MGLHRAKVQKAQKVSVPKLDLSQVKSAPEENVQSNVYGCEEHGKPAVSGGEIAEALAMFEDFWDDGDDNEVEEKKKATRGKATEVKPAARNFSSSCAFKKVTRPTRPRSRSKCRKTEPLMFNLSTPPVTPREPLPQKRDFVPHWPYGSKWPFNCAPTTLELRGLPRGCSAEVIIKQLDQWGFAGKYNLVHVAKAGMATLNAARHVDGCALAGRLHEFSDWRVKGAATSGDAALKFKTQKACRVNWSFEGQGLEALVVAYHQDADSNYYTADGLYAGPWILCGSSWWPLFSPVHMWPVAATTGYYQAPEWQAETQMQQGGMAQSCW